MRRRNLAFEHHKLVAKYDHAMQDKWLALAEKHGMGKRRLDRSIEAGRVLTPKDLRTTDPSKHSRAARDQSTRGSNYDPH